MSISLLTPLHMVPDGEQVAKVKGGVLYTVRRALRIYGATPDKTYDIDATLGTVFLVHSDGNATATNGDKVVVWTVDKSKLLKWLDDRDPE